MESVEVEIRQPSPSRVGLPDRVIVPEDDAVRLQGEQTWQPVRVGRRVPEAIALQAERRDRAGEVGRLTERLAGQQQASSIGLDRYRLVPRRMPGVGMTRMPGSGSCSPSTSA